MGKQAITVGIIFLLLAQFAYAGSLLTPTKTDLNQTFLTIDDTQSASASPPLHIKGGASGASSGLLRIENSNPTNAIGTGSALEYYTKDNSGVAVEQARIGTTLTDGTIAASRSNLLIYTRDGPDGLTQKVSIGTGSAYTVDVSAKAMKLGLEKNGGGQLIIGNEPNDNKIYLEAFSKDGTGTAKELVFSGRYVAPVNMTFQNEWAHFTGELQTSSHMVIKSPDPYLRTNTDNKHMVISGGSGWTSTGATIIARGKSAASNAGGFEFYGADGTLRNAHFHNLNIYANNNFYAGGYNVGAGKINTYSIEVGGISPTNSGNNATIFFHHHGRYANQLRYTDGTLYWEPTTTGYGTVTPNLSMSGHLFAGGLCLAGDCKTSWSQLGSQWGVSGSNLYYSTGSVGIGTSNPTTTLHIAGDNANIGISRNPAVDPNAYARLGMTAGWIQYLGNNLYWNGANWMFVNTGGYGGVGSLITQETGTMRFFTASGGTNPVTPTERFTILNNGNIGIGNSNPDAKLAIGSQLAGSVHSTTLRTHAGTLGTTAGSELALASIGFSSGNNEALGFKAYRTANGPDWTTTAVGLQMDVDNTPRVNAASLWLKADGNIGIGTATPAAKIQIQGGGLGIGGPGASISGADGSRRSIQLATDTRYGGTYDDHSGALMYTIMPGGWGTAELHVRISNNWGTYSGADALVIKENELRVNGKITNVGAPTAGTDAANKDYVDSRAGGGVAIRAATSSYYSPTPTATCPAGMTVQAVGTKVKGCEAPEPAPVSMADLRDPGSCAGQASCNGLSAQNCWDSGSSWSQIIILCSK